MSNAIDVTGATFDTEVLKSSTLVLVDFWATWCAPCRMLAPAVDAVAQDLGAKLKVVKVNLDTDQALAMKYQVMSIPTLILFKGGQQVDRKQGALPKDQLKAWVESKL
jgi:thioredoxin 1